MHLSSHFYGVVTHTGMHPKVCSCTLLGEDDSALACLGPSIFGRKKPDWPIGGRAERVITIDTPCTH